MQQIANRQLGYVTRGQLLAAGASPRWIESQRDQSTLVSVHAGVYAVGHLPRGAHPRAMAAVLACGEGAVLSHWSAAALWEIAQWPPCPEVTAVGCHRRSGLVTHRSSTLSGSDVRRRHGIPVTAPARTILDLCSRVSDARLVRLVNDLRTAGELRATAFADLCARSARIERLLGDGDLTESALEDLFRAFVARHRLPMPELQVWLAIGGRRRRVDAYYREARLIVELDSWRHHSDRDTFERDRGKDALALAEGYLTLRSTHRRLRRSGEHEAGVIRRILAGDPTPVIEKPPPRWSIAHTRPQRRPRTPDRAD